MLLFSHILDLEENQTKEAEKREEQRYVPGRPFPLYATIDVDGEPRSAKILDLSPLGVGLQVAGPSYVLWSDAKLHLMLEQAWMEFPCRIAHIRTLPIGCRLGLTVRFENFAAQKAYLQLLQPVAIGSVLRPVPSEEVRQDDPARHKLVFTGRPGTELTVWRQGDVTGVLHRFLWQMDDYMVRGETAVGVMQIFSRKGMGCPSPEQTTPLLGKFPVKVEDEIRLLFRWTMMNLPKEVPDDIRAFLRTFVD